MAKILVTGASGFVGKRLILYLLNQGHVVYALSRVKGIAIFAEDRSNLHYLWGDLRDEATLQALPLDIHAAYYLVHSMSDIMGDLVQAEIETITRFIVSVARTQIKQIIYLSGIVNDERNLSKHLKSRLLVEKVIRSSNIPYTVLRASIIIGAGSASFEIIRDLCEKLPLMVAPKWIHCVCQPISMQDVIFYLSAVLLNEKCKNTIFDIGGPDVLTFKDILLGYAKFRNLKRWIIDVPVLTPRLSSYWLVFITSVRYSLCSYLVESMKTNTVVQVGSIQEILPHRCLHYVEALELAFQKIAQNEVISSWMDSWEVKDVDPNIQTYIQVPTEGCLQDQQIVEVKDSKEATIARIWCIGGRTGYYAFNWAWKLRGFIDQMIGGVGLNRGRQHLHTIEVGDSIDFWRVLRADKERGHLILYAGMKLPGQAWLEFQCQEKDNRIIFIQTATFRPKGILGRLYWYLLLPIHCLIFYKMAKALAGCSS